MAENLAERVEALLDGMKLTSWEELLRNASDGTPGLVRALEEAIPKLCRLCANGYTPLPTGYHLSDGLPMLYQEECGALRQRATLRRVKGALDG